MPIPLIHHFNSIKVRLKLSATATAKPDVTFQFHKGTIKTVSGGFNALGSMLFQFHKGTIKTVDKTIGLVGDCNFNSIKVRLKHALRNSYDYDNDFNSIKVRLKLLSERGDKSLSLISIP